MLVTTLLILAALSFLSVGVLMSLSYRDYLRRGKVFTDDAVDGHEALKQALFALLRISTRKIMYVRRFVTAYFLHVFVRLLRFFDRFSFALYVRSRNTFVKNAIRQKGTVSHFWEHLKTYKQEIDREKELFEEEK